MTAYFDSSAFVALLLDEPGSAAARDVWRGAEQVASSGITYVEVAAALAHAERLGRCASAEVEALWSEFEYYWDSVNAVGVGPYLLESAAGLTRPHALRGYDAVQCASALVIDGGELVAVTGDRQLLAAWRERGLATVDTSAT